MPPSPKFLMTKKNDIIHVDTPRAWDINIEYMTNFGRKSLKKVAGRMPNKKTMINKYDRTINKGSSSSVALVIPQQKIDIKRTTPATKKKETAKPFTPVYTFIKTVPRSSY